MVVAPEPESEPPGSTSQVRTLSELLTAYDRTLSDSTALTAELTPRNWLGPASEAYQEQAKNPFEVQLRAVREINAVALEAVEHHQDFRAQLANLWQDPRERAHMRTVHRHASDQLAARLFAKAAELDRLANFDEVQRAPVNPVVLPPAPWPIPGSRRAGKPPAREPDEEPDGQDPLVALDPRDENGQAGSGGNAGHNGHGVLPRATAATAVSRDETERAAWLRTMPLPRMVRTDITWDGDD